MEGNASGRRLVLGLDSCGTETTLALGELFPGSVRIARELLLPARTAGARLTGAFREVLGGVAPGSLAALVVVRGPGSFTGMRVGLSAAKAIAEAAGVPLVAVSRLGVLGELARGVSVALHAGRGSVYLRTPADGKEQLLPAEEARAAVPDGESLAVCEDKVAALFPQARRLPPPTAADALLYSRARVLARDWDDAGTLDALYLWRPEQMLRAPSP